MPPSTPAILALAALAALFAAASARAADDPWVVMEGRDGPGRGKHIVLLAGDDEYRSEELIPALARIAAARHGFKCTVLFAVNRETGEIDPATLDNIPGLEALDSADLMVMFLRFRELPDDQMKRIIDYTNSGRSVMGLRTSTHAFNYARRPDSPYARYSWRSADPKGGYGRMVFGETWINHYGRHNVQSTRGLVAPGMEKHPLVRGCEDVWGPSDVYGLTTLEGDCTPVLMGQVLAGMNPTDAPVADKPALPVAWTKTFTGASGRAARVFTTTMGHAGDLKSEGLRRLLVNALFWCTGMEDRTPERAAVDFVGPYDPSPIGMGKFRKGVRPADHRLPQSP
jgi:type 1 glutamine amidotransferase